MDVSHSSATQQNEMEKRTQTFGAGGHKRDFFHLLLLAAVFFEAQVMQPHF